MTSYPVYLCFDLSITENLPEIFDTYFVNNDQIH